MKEKKYCTACQSTRLVTDKAQLIRRAHTARWMCEWCVDKLKKPVKAEVNRSQQHGQSL